jgi:hypothetical protein
VSLSMLLPCRVLLDGSTVVVGGGAEGVTAVGFAPAGPVVDGTEVSWFMSCLPVCSKSTVTGTRPRRVGDDDRSGQEVRQVPG